ncbi:MAG: DNA repair protein RecO [Deltaproteobacteria bacterium]|nr:DNA repair protein RecO [Deltaproteobacteria bacterium]
MIAMNTRAIHKTRAVVLHTLDYGESDRIATFYTLEFGKVKGIAKGARRSRRRFANALEPFSCADIRFSRKGDSLAFVDQCDMVDHFPTIRSDLEKSMSASYLVELTGAFTVEGKKNELIFKLLIDFLSVMDNGPFIPGLLSFFEIRLLHLSGYEPVLDRCALCNRPLEAESSYRFSNSRGGLKCSRCDAFHPPTPSLSIGTLRSLIHAKDMPVNKLSRLTLSRQSAQESRQLLVHFIQHLLGRELKSLQVLHQLRQIGAIG